MENKTVPSISAEGCDCPDDTCAHLCEPASQCVDRLARQGEVALRHCVRCAGASGGGPTMKTWHLDGKCMCCKEAA